MSDSASNCLVLELFSAILCMLLMIKVEDESAKAPRISNIVNTWTVLKYCSVSIHNSFKGKEQFASQYSRCRWHSINTDLDRILLVYISIK